jgi:hypothetical protein
MFVDDVAHDTGKQEPRHQRDHREQHNERDRHSEEEPEGEYERWKSRDGRDEQGTVADHAGEPETHRDRASKDCRKDDDRDKRCSHGVDYPLWRLRSSAMTSDGGMSRSASSTSR